MLRKSLVSLFVLVFAAGPSLADETCVYDDETTENGLGLTAGGDTCWIHYCEPIGCLAVTHINSAFCHNPDDCPEDGTPVQVYIWDDVNDDGDPSDAILLGQGSGVLTGGGMDIFNYYELDSPVTMGCRRFFIGVVVTHVPGQYPAPLDSSQASMGRAWIAGSLTPGGFDPHNLNNNDLPPTEMDSLGYPGVFLLRADAEPAFSIYRAFDRHFTVQSPSIQARTISLAVNPSV